MDGTAGKAAYQAVASTLGLSLSMPEPTDPQPRFALWGELDAFCVPTAEWLSGLVAYVRATARGALDRRAAAGLGGTAWRRSPR